MKIHQLEGDGFDEMVDTSTMAPLGLDVPQWMKDTGNAIVKGGKAVIHTTDTLYVSPFEIYQAQESGDWESLLPTGQAKEWLKTSTGKDFIKVAGGLLESYIKSDIEKSAKSVGLDYKTMGVSVAKSNIMNKVDGIKTMLYQQVQGSITGVTQTAMALVAPGLGNLYVAPIQSVVNHMVFNKAWDTTIARVVPQVLKEFYPSASSEVLEVKTTKESSMEPTKSTWYSDATAFQQTEGYYNSELRKIGVTTAQLREMTKGMKANAVDYAKKTGGKIAPFIYRLGTRVAYNVETSSARDLARDKALSGSSKSSALPVMIGAGILAKLFLFS